MKKNLIPLLFGAASLLGGSALPAADTESRPFPGVRYVHRHTTEPREIDMHIVIVDLNQPGVKVKTTGANGDRPGETDLETTRAFVKRSQAQIGINSGFFGRTTEKQGLGGADLCSLAVSDGVKVSDWGTWIKDAINIGADNAVTFVTRAKDDTTGYMTTPEMELYNALSGNARLLRDGVVLPGKGGDTTYPQTAVGQRWRANSYRIDYDTAPASHRAWDPRTESNFHDYQSFGTVTFE